MTITPERFARGMTYDEHRAQMTRNRERHEANEQGLVPAPEDLAVFRALPRALRVLVLTEDWCGDCVANVPILGRLAKESGKLDLRVFYRDQNKDLMADYLSEGRYESIPVVVFLDDDFREIGRFIERPKSVTDLRARRRREIYASDPEFGSPDDPPDRLPEEVRGRLQRALAAMREETKPFADREVVRELRAIAERAVA